jgi:DNA polymerase elongation subunit (family B)
MKLQGQNIVVFDCEICEPIAGQVTWNRHDLMGISVACAFDFRSNDYLVFMKDNLEGLVARLNSADLIVGFNIINFDLPLVAATCKTALGLPLPVYDLLPESRRAAGWDESQRFPKGMKLDDHLEATFGREHMKTSNGEEAPRMWKDGRLGELVSYCLADVKREAMLFRHVWEGRPVRTPLHPERLLKSPKDPSFWTKGAPRAEVGV